MPKLRSLKTIEGREMAGARALWHATGTKVEDFGKPVICVVNSYTQFVPGHVHLKDRLAAHDTASPAIGTGVVPMTEVIQSLQNSGYNGWLTVEHYGSRNMLQDATLSIRFLQTALKDKDFPKQEGMKPQMSEYWSPQPKLVSPGADRTAPSDAIVLFDGENLNEWQSDKGEAAGWKVENVLECERRESRMKVKEAGASLKKSANDEFIS